MRSNRKCWLCFYYSRMVMTSSCLLRTREVVSISIEAVDPVLGLVIVRVNLAYENVSSISIETPVAVLGLVILEFRRNCRQYRYYQRQHCQINWTDCLVCHKLPEPWRGSYRFQDLNPEGLRSWRLERRVNIVRGVDQIARCAMRYQTRRLILPNPIMKRYRRNLHIIISWTRLRLHRGILYFSGIDGTGDNSRPLQAIACQGLCFLKSVLRSRPYWAVLMGMNCD